MLQQLLDESDIESVVLIDLRRKEFTERMSTDALYVKEVTHKLQLLLDRALRDWKDTFI